MGKAKKKAPRTERKAIRDKRKAPWKLRMETQRKAGVHAQDPAWRDPKTGKRRGVN